ncbi:hypothetical protein [Shewanella phaeophyticola]|uniref:Amino acid ABC transporter substrate-binding protein n=1 Tax=Shewanella phaeophyticola TaxID=2978345 RepID=A0ABT2NYT5_9GAMM|nr:hypothetical protein [Shewanella sp. KJ10-1]MCT8985559.1 hypothetical protein [Shewanella sp. KJ10-1]
MNAVTRFCISMSLLLLGAFALNPTCQSNDEFIINRSESELDNRYQYPYDLLTLVIEATTMDFGEGSLLMTDLHMSRNRIFRSLKEGDGINVIAEASKVSWNEELIPIKIPIRKGIQGFRVFIVKQENATVLANITSLPQFVSLKTGSGSQWSTKVAMQQAGFDVVESTLYDNLFNMLSKGRFVTFGRGVNEVFQEVSQFHQQYPELMVDEHLLLHIPLATYFYVSPNQPRLARRIEVGLQRIIENGQFDQLFYQRHCEFLLEAKLNNRLVFKIDNPYISETDISSVGNDFLLNPKDDFDTLCKQYR